MSRVLVVGVNFAPETTGNAPYTTGMAQALSAEHDVHVVTAHPHYPQWKVLDGHGGWRHDGAHGDVALTRLKHYVPRTPTSAARISSELTFALRAALVRLPKPDVVVTVTPSLLPLAPVLWRARRWRAPIGIVVQDLYAKAATEMGLLGGRLDRTLGRTEARLLSAADGVVSIHERMADVISRDYGVNREAIRIIPNWTHISTPHANREVTRTRLGWSSDSFVVLHAGNMGAKQGLEHVVAAARRADELRTNVQFVLMGDGNRRNELEQHALGVERLTFMDPSSDDEFADVLAAADVLLLHERPGLKEMCAPSKLTSYFAASRPILGVTDADSAGAFEIMSSGAGVVVEPGSPDLLLQGLESLRADDAVRLGVRGREYARARLSEEQAHESYRRWVKSLLTTVQ